MAIVPGSNSTDAHYIQAALNAIAQYSNRKINTAMVRSSASLQPNTQLIFWLDEQQPASEALTALSPGGTLFQYDTGQVIKASSWLSSQQQSLSTKQPGRLYRYAAGRSYGQSVWTLASGEPLLTDRKRTAVPAGSVSRSVVSGPSPRPSNKA